MTKTPVIISVYISLGNIYRSQVRPWVVVVVDRGSRVHTRMSAAVERVRHGRRRRGSVVLTGKFDLFSSVCERVRPEPEPVGPGFWQGTGGPVTRVPWISQGTGGPVTRVPWVWPGTARTRRTRVLDCAGADGPQPHGPRLLVWGHCDGRFRHHCCVFPRA